MLVERVKNLTKEIGDICVGDCFINPDDDCIYMRTDEKDSQGFISCINLETGRIYYFIQRAEVNVSREFKLIEIIKE